MSRLARAYRAAVELQIAVAHGSDSAALRLPSAWARYERLAAESRSRLAAACRADKAAADARQAVSA